MKSMFDIFTDEELEILKENIKKQASECISEDEVREKCKEIIEKSERFSYEIDNFLKTLK